tara:strand:- start:8849 stop:9235 length:387 start_codon:yes stop_codon:yes gene_type:complete
MTHPSHGCDASCPNYSHYEKTIRPWGSYEVLHEEEGLKVKKITVKAGNRLSLQKHSRREEFWTIIHGKGLITLGDKTLAVLSGLQVHILVEQLHRIEATTEDIVFIESQKGDYLEEDDIVRIEDDYER